MHIRIPLIESAALAQELTTSKALLFQIINRLPNRKEPMATFTVAVDRSSDPQCPLGQFELNNVLSCYCRNLPFHYYLSTSNMMHPSIPRLTTNIMVEKAAHYKKCHIYNIYQSKCSPGFKFTRICHNIHQKDGVLVPPWPCHRAVQKPAHCNIPMCAFGQSYAVTH